MKTTGNIAKYIDALLTSGRFRSQVAHHGVLPPVAAQWGRPAPPARCGSARSVLRYGVFDLETRRSAEEVGGWHHAERMGLSCAVVCDAGQQAYLELLEDQVDELLALRWWKEGRVREVIDYCRTDVRLTRVLFLLGCCQGHLLFHNKAGQTVRLPVDWRRFVVASDGDGQASGLQKEPQ